MAGWLIAGGCAADPGSGAPTGEGTTTTDPTSTSAGPATDSSSTATDVTSAADTTGGGAVDPGLPVACQGEGEPTIVFEAGLGDSGDIFVALRNDLAADTRVCTYTRRGVGRVPPADGIRSTAALTEDLLAVLDFHGITEPAVFVGHSLGGFPIRQLHDLAPERFAGAVLIDTSSPQYNGWLFGVLDPRDIAGYEAYLAGDNAESIDLAQSFEEILALDEDWGELPLSVVAAGQFEPAGRASADEVGMAWHEQQMALAQLSTAGVYVVSEASTHYVYLQDPDLVLAEIRRVLAEATSG